MTTRNYELSQQQVTFILVGLRRQWQDTQLALEAASNQPQISWRVDEWKKLEKQQLELIQFFLTVYNTKAKGLCPICHGAGYTRIAETSRKWYPEKHFHKCSNCGGQYQGGILEVDLGMVNLHRVSGLPCSHDYTYTKLGNCYHGYTCKNCGDSHNIDSGD